MGLQPVHEGQGGRHGDGGEDLHPPLCGVAHGGQDGVVVPGGAVRLEHQVVGGADQGEAGHPAHGALEGSEVRTASDVSDRCQSG